MINNWWIKESVVQDLSQSSTPPCDDSIPNQTLIPIQFGNCAVDNNVSPNGPPELVAPCFDVFSQIIWIGPTFQDALDKKCGYVNALRRDLIGGLALFANGNAVTSCFYPEAIP
jgi:hypothetical protein